jgi:energy-coupling factor transporter ATP-binding protein EcfA2
MPAPIVLSDLSFAWPDGRAVFDGLDPVIGAGRTGLVGASGAGRSTLLRLIAGELAPARGSAAVTGSLGYLRQDVTLQAGRSVADVLGVAGVAAAPRPGVPARPRPDPVAAPRRRPARDRPPVMPPARGRPSHPGRRPASWSHAHRADL